MKGYFTLFTGSDAQFYFNLKAGNNEIILQSEGYTSEQGALNGIQSVQSNCGDDDNYERKVAKDGSPYFVLKAQNGEPIGKSEMYSSTQAMENGIDSVKSNGKTTKVEGHSDGKEFNIILNKKPYKVSSDTLNGAQILALGDFDLSKYDLFLVRGNDQDEISDDQVVSLKNGMKFQAILSDIKFG
ncbi:MAG: multiubiquitin domain-containing protein [Cryomorphaceae bacterium]